MTGQTNELWQSLWQIIMIFYQLDYPYSLLKKAYIYVWALMLLIFQIPQLVSKLTKKKL